MRKLTPLLCIGILVFGVISIAQGAAKKFTTFHACSAEPGNGDAPDGMMILNHNRGNNVPGDNGATVFQLVLSNFEPGQTYDLEMVGFGFIAGIVTDDKGQATFHGESPGDFTGVSVLKLWAGDELRASTDGSCSP